jgi:hypothetical protein
MNWFVFENAPSWFWLHALKPLTNSESAGYGLGYWNPVIDPVVPSNVLPGHFEFNADNFNAIAGFLNHMPWDSVRLDVVEDVVRSDQRVLAYLFDPARARWRYADGRAPPLPRGASSRETLRDGARARAAATHRAVVVSNRWFEHAFDARVAFAGARGGAAPAFDGYAYGPAFTNVSLGRRTADADAVTGEWGFNVTVDALTLQFWVEVV